MRIAPPAFAALFLLAACKSAPPPSQSQAAAPVNVTAAPAPAAASATPAEVGKPAPDFALPDVNGATVKLSDYRGKVVVLEWWNPECPFVRASHTKGSLNGLEKRYEARGIAWIAIDSSAPGKQGNAVDKILEGKAKYGMAAPILRDEKGEVGHLYGATNTPNMFVIDAKGTLVYRGAIDNSPDGEGESPTSGKLVNYVEDALEATLAGRPVATHETKAYGCGVKY